MSTVNSLTIPISVISNTRDKNLAHRIVSGDSGAYTILITWTDIATISGTVQLYFVLGDGTYATRDSSDGVVLLNNTVTYTLEEALYSVAGNLTCYVQFLNSNLFTPLKLTFSGIHIPAGTTLVAPVIAYPAWVTSVASAEALRVIAESARVIAEGSRVSVEGLRVTAENSRVSVENNRVTAEGLRVTAEGNRVIAEGSRVTAEGLRVTAEGNRVIAESGRNSSYVIAEAARDDLYDAAEAVRNIFEAFDSGNYNVGNKVAYLGSSYVCTVTTTAGELPTDTGHWLLIASAGDLVQADLDARVNPIEAQQVMQDDIDLGNLSEPISNPAMIYKTGTGVKNGITLTNPISFKDSGERVEMLGVTVDAVNVVNPVLRTTGKNGFDKADFVANCTKEGVTVSQTATGVRVTSTSTGSYRVCYKNYNLIPLETYHAKRTINILSGASNTLDARTEFQDTTFGTLGIISKIQTETSFIVPASGIVVMTFYAVTNIDGDGDVEFNDVQFELGSVATTYEAFKSNSLALTGTLRSVVDSGVLYQDRLYNSSGTWKVDRYVNPADGLKQAMATENATVTGKPYVYRDGTTSIETSVIAPKVDMNIPYAQVENTYIPTLTWVTATPTIASSRHKYVSDGEVCAVNGNVTMSDGKGATNVTITIPIPVGVGKGNRVVHMNMRINTTWTEPVVRVIESTNLVTFAVPFALTNGQPAELEYDFVYGVA